MSGNFEIHSNEEAINPLLDARIDMSLREFEASLQNGKKAEFRRLALQGDRGDLIDTACWALGERGDIDKSIDLKALRYTRKICKPIYQQTSEHVEFTHPLIGDQNYWRRVDDRIMEYIELQTKSHEGEFIGFPKNLYVEKGDSGYLQIARFLGRTISKKLLYVNRSPIHVWYAVQPMEPSKTSVADN